MTILIIDIGSSSVRALLFDDHARPIPGAVVRCPHRFTTTPTGAATLDMETVQARIEACIDDLLQHPHAQDIQVVGTDTFVGNLLGIDARNNPCTPVYSYADTRSADDVTFLKSRIDETVTHQRTGCIHHVAYHPGRLHWLRRTNSTLFDSVALWTDLGTYLYRQWFGRAACSYSIASWSGLLNRATCAWDANWLDILDIDLSLFPPLTDYTEMLSGLTDVYTERWPVLRDVPFCLPVGDGAAANVGSGCVDESRIALTVGTTAALRLVSRATLPEAPQGLWGYRVDAGRHLIGGATSEGGSVFRWVHDTLGLTRLSDLEDQLTSRQPDAHELAFLPLLAGERAPGWASDASGAILGLRLSTDAVDILQAALEGVALRLALIAERLLPFAGDHVQMVASGGALVASPAWAQMIANAINLPLHLTDNDEVTARGVAVLALRAIGDCELDAFPPEIARTFEPNLAHAAALRKAGERQIGLYNRLISGKPD